jgi:hypothetical protein
LPLASAFTSRLERNTEDRQMSAHRPSVTLESHTLTRRLAAADGQSMPKPGDVLASEPTARADVYAISVVPAAAHMVMRRYPEAIEKVRELARQRGVDGWYTVDQTHYAQIASYRTR